MSTLLHPSGRVVGSPLAGEGCRAREGSDLIDCRKRVCAAAAAAEGCDGEGGSDCWNGGE